MSLNQEEFLDRVFDWLNTEELYASFWFFDNSDGPICRANFIENENTYREKENSKIAANDRLAELYLEILDQVHEGCDLVDNPKFLWFITDNQIYDIDPEVRALFETDQGAQPFTNVEDLVIALTAMYEERKALGLEQIDTPDFPPLIDVDTCTEETIEAASNLADNLFNKIEETAEINNMVDYLIRISEWIVDMNTPAPAPRRGI